MAESDQARRVRDAVAREGQREVYARRCEPGTHPLDMRVTLTVPEGISADDAQRWVDEAIHRALAVESWTRPAATLDTATGGVKVGSEREGWRARLAHVELLLTEGTEIAGERDGAYDSDKIRQALAAVRSMLDLEPSAPPVEYVTAPIGQCGRTLVGRGGDTWDPVCVREGGHEGPCKPHPDLDREPSS
jgi:hypothetical protein